MEPNLNRERLKKFDVVAYNNHGTVSPVVLLTDEDKDGWAFVFMLEWPYNSFDNDVSASRKLGQLVYGDVI